MSPLLDTQATRRDALMGFGALFLALLGMPQFFNEVAAAEPVPDLAAATIIDGIFVGTVNAEPVIAHLLLEADGIASKVTIGELDRKRAPELELMVNKPAVGELVASIGDGMTATTKNARRIAPSFSRPLKGKPVPVTCPDCKGYRSFDCDTCEGAGVVPHWPILGVA